MAFRSASRKALRHALLLLYALLSGCNDAMKVLCAAPRKEGTSRSIAKKPGEWAATVDQQSSTSRGASRLNEPHALPQRGRSALERQHRLVIPAAAGGREDLVSVTGQTCFKNSEASNQTQKTLQSTNSRDRTSPVSEPARRHHKPTAVTDAVAFFEKKKNFSTAARPLFGPTASQRGAAVQYWHDTRSGQESSNQKRGRQETSRDKKPPPPLTNLIELKNLDSCKVQEHREDVAVTETDVNSASTLKREKSLEKEKRAKFSSRPAPPQPPTRAARSQAPPEPMNRSTKQKALLPLGQFSCPEEDCTAETGAGVSTMPSEASRSLQPPRRAPDVRRGTSESGVSLRPQIPSAMRSLIAFFKSFSFLWLPLSLLLVVVGVTAEDMYSIAAGATLLSGGCMLHMLSLLALRLRRHRVSDVIPLTSHNVNLIFGIPSVFSLWAMTRTCYIAFTLASAAWVSRRDEFFLAVAISSVLVFLSWATLVTVTTRRFCLQLRTLSNVGRPVAGLEVLESEAAALFETALPSAAMAPCGSEENTERVPRGSCLSRLLAYGRRSLYSAFVTFTGAALTLAVCLTRTRRFTAEPILEGGLPISPPLFEDIHAYRAHLQSFRYRFGVARSLQLVGYLGVAYMLLAVGALVVRCLRSRAGDSRSTRRRTLRQHCGVRANMALVFLPLLRGFEVWILCHFSALFYALGYSEREFLYVIEDAIAYMGVLVALMPACWTALQSIGVSLPRMRALFMQWYEEQDSNSAAVVSDTENTPSTFSQSSMLVSNRQAEGGAAGLTLAGAAEEGALQEPLQGRSSSDEDSTMWNEEDSFSE